MARLTLVQAVNDALRTEMELDPRVVLLGEDIGRNGGVFRATEGLIDKFGEDRVMDTPLAESGIIGTAIGMAAYGLRPVPEMQFFGFIYPAFDQVASHLARIRQRSRGRWEVPVTIRAPYGGGIRGPELHSESTEAFFAHLPGLKIVVPSSPYEAKGLLISAIRDPDPVLYLEPMKIYRAFREEVPEEAYTIPIGKARIVREGTDLTLIAWGALIPTTLEAAKQLSEQGIEAEVIDLRTIYPLDMETVLESVKKTGRCVIVQEAARTAGMGAEIAARIQEEAFLYLEAPVGRVAGFDTPIPLFVLEELYQHPPRRIVRQALETARF